MSKSILITLFYTIFLSVNTSAMIQTHLFLKRLGPCPRAPQTVVVVSEFSITRERYSFTLYGELNVTEDIPDDWRIEATMQKCQDIRNLDTCDYYKSFPLISSGCSQVASKERDYYAVLFATADPNMKCPLKAGNYKIKGYPYTSRNISMLVAESKISTSMFGYTYRIDGYDNEDEKIFCIEAILRVIYLRDHKLVDETVDENTYKKDHEEGDSAAKVSNEESDSGTKNNSTNLEDITTETVAEDSTE